MNNCKRVSLGVLTMLFMMTAWSQNISFFRGDKGNGKGYQPTMLVVDKADAEGRYYSVEPELNAFSKVKGIVVREVDVDYKESRKVGIANTKGCGIMHAHREGMNMHVVTSGYDDGRITLRHVCVDLSTFTIVSDSVLVDLPEKKGDFFYHWDALASGGSYYGLVYAKVNEKAGSAEVRAMLFDRGMRRQWVQDLSLGAISQILVTDDGRIVTVGYSNGDNNGDGAMLEFAVTTATGTLRGRYASVYKVGEVALLGCFGNRVLATALETDRGTGWAGSFAAGAVVTTGTVYTGCASYLFDVGEGRMVNTDRHTFGKEDARVFYSASLISEITSPDVNFLSLRGSASTTWGGAALYGRSWHEKVIQQGTGMSTETYYYKGMMVFGVDTTGRFVWIRPLMHDNALGGMTAERTETDMVAYGDNLYLFTNETTDDGDTYNPDKPAHKALIKPHGTISAYIFSPEGNVTKRVVVTEGINSIITPLRRQGDGRYTFVSGSLKGCISEITIRK